MAILNRGYEPLVHSSWIKPRDAHDSPVLLRPEHTNSSHCFPFDVQRKAAQTLWIISQAGRQSPRHSLCAQTVSQVSHPTTSLEQRCRINFDSLITLTFALALRTPQFSYTRIMHFLSCALPLYSASCSQTNECKRASKLDLTDP